MADAPLTPTELEAIRARHAETVGWSSVRQSHKDRGALLAEVDRLRAALRTISAARCIHLTSGACSDCLRATARSALGPLD